MSARLTVALVLAAAVAAGQPAPVPLTSQQDRQRLMDLLHVRELRRGADGSHPDAPNAANYDESKANPYPKLPDPLTLQNGKRVKDARVWWTRRRREIVEDFDREVYGRVPAHTPGVNWEATATTHETNGEIPVIVKKLVGHVDNTAYPAIAVDLQLTLTTPAAAKGPVPVVLEYGFNFAAMRPRGRALPPPPAPAGPTWQQQVLARGWGYAVLFPTSVQPDNGQGLTQGIIGLMNRGQPRGLDQWGALRAWAWGGSRVLDYLATDPAVDAKRVAVEGHSRYGKAALVTMAYDSRFAIAYVSSSGEGGAKLHRRNWGEPVENVAGTGEYHWMAGNFLKYAGPLTWNDLPVDSHELVALCAPRPVFIGAGATKGDGWVDAKGMFLAATGAGPVYRLLGRKDLGTTKFPPIETALTSGDIAFRQHSGGHTPGPNWPFFLDFAARYFAGRRFAGAGRMAAWPAGRDNTGIMRQLTAADSGKEVSLGVGESLAIDLAENPTTGYRWSLEAGPAAVLQNVSDSFRAGKKPGEEGLHQWVLRAVGAGSGSVAGRYQRSWAPSDPPARTFSVRVRVSVQSPGEGGTRL